MSKIAIIPARSGSKGLKDKNIRILNNKPLLSYSIEAAIKSGLFDEVMVSTDSERYSEIAKEYGARVPFLRSAENSEDNSNSFDVVREVLYKYLEKGKKFESICLLQPTSPLRLAKDIVGAYNLFYEREALAVTSVSEATHSPLWMNTLPEDGSMEDFRNREFDGINRQNLPRYYLINGAIYIRKIGYGNKIQIADTREFAYVMPRERSVDIDTELDFIVAEEYMRTINNRKEGINVLN